MAMIPPPRIENKDKQHQNPKPKKEAKAHFFLWSKEGRTRDKNFVVLVLVLNFCGLCLLVIGIESREPSGGYHAGHTHRRSLLAVV